MSSKEGEEGRSWGAHGVRREGLKGVPLQIFKAAGGDLLHVHHGAAGLKTHQGSPGRLCAGRDGQLLIVNREQGAGGSPVPFSILCPSSEPPDARALKAHLVSGHVGNYVLSGQHSSWPIVAPPQIFAC